MADIDDVMAKLEDVMEKLAEIETKVNAESDVYAICSHCAGPDLDPNDCPECGGTGLRLGSRIKKRDA